MAGSTALWVVKLRSAFSQVVAYTGQRCATRLIRSSLTPLTHPLAAGCSSHPSRLPGSSGPTTGGGITHHQLPLRLPVASGLPFRLREGGGRGGGDREQRERWGGMGGGGEGGPAGGGGGGFK